MASNFIRDPSHPKWNAHNSALRRMVGLPSERLPENPTTLELGQVDGFRVYLRPFRGDGRRTHRMRAVCQCGADISAGRTHQHKCKGTL